MIIMVGVVQVFITEQKTSRLYYDSIVATAQADGAFEYALLKIANHRDGFQDSLRESDPDQILWSGSTARTNKNTVNYEIRAQTLSWDITLAPNEIGIFPLFVGAGNLIAWSSNSRDPSLSMNILPVKSLRLIPSGWNNDAIAWNIVATDTKDQNNIRNISISGTGGIDGANTIWMMRLDNRLCLSNAGETVFDCQAATTEEELIYFYDMSGSVNDFLSNPANLSHFSSTYLKTTEPYLIVFNTDPNNAASFHLETDSPFTLPKMELYTEARKWDAVKRIRYSNDKSRYYDALKYSLYDVGDN